MEENRDEKIEEPKIHSPFVTWVENFWYHYKWHTIVGLFVLLILGVTTFQMCSRPKYDCNLIYAGPMNPTAAHLTDMQNSLYKVMDDYNGNGEKNVSIERYWIDTAENILGSKGDRDTGLLMNSVRENKEALRNEVMAGEAFLCFLSPEEFQWMDKYKEGDSQLLMSVFTVFPEVDESLFYTYPDGTKSDCGIRLSALPFSHLPGFSSMPKDTVICLRNVGEMKKWFGSQKELETQHKYHRELFKSIITYN